ncbi:MAG: DnaJ domain-containing protein, partial [Chloroflexota bacterium]|nr:DnaJ domain-containing protein [Chloroflexota bacterium]
SHDEVAAQMRQLEARGTAALGVGAPNGRTLYQILQVDTAADPEVIEAAYKRLALKHHPDRSSEADAPERMRELNGARAVLLDPLRRRAHDAYLGVPERIDALRADEV